MKVRCFLILFISILISISFSFVKPSSEVFAHSDEVKFTKSLFPSYSDTPECYINMKTKHCYLEHKIEEAEYDSIEALLKKITGNDSESIEIISKTNINKKLLTMVLNYAFETENYEKILKLIEKGADVKKIDNEYYSQVKNPEILKLLIKYKVDLSDAFLEKLKNNEQENYKLILDSYPEYVLNKNRDGMTAIMAAVISRNFDAVNYFNEKGAPLHVAYKNGDSPLMMALVNNPDFKIAKLLVEQGSDVNVKNIYGESPLELVVQKDGNDDLVKYLIEQGADDNNKIAALSRALANNKSKYVSIISGSKIDFKNIDFDRLADRIGLEAFKYLVKNGFDINDKLINTLISKKKKDILKYIVQNLMRSGDYLSKIESSDFYKKNIAVPSKNNLESLEVFIEKSKNPSDLESLLRLASQSNNLNVVRKLIDLKVPAHEDDVLKAINDNNVELLSIIIKEFKGFRVYRNGLFFNASNPAIVKIIFEYYLKNRDDNDYAREIYHYIENRNAEVSKMIINGLKTPVFGTENCYMTGVPKTTFINMAIVNDMNEILELLIKKGADVNKPGNYGLAPVILASWLDKKTALKILIASGANINSKSPDGTSALMFAAMAGHNDVIKFLLDHGADINYKNEYGFSALSEAIKCFRTESVELLKKNGANIEEAERTVKKIKNLGTNINTKDRYGVSMLMRTIYENNFIKTKYLIDHGADVNETNETRTTITSPLISSVCSGNILEFYKLLIDHGADPYFGHNEKAFIELLSSAFALNSNIFKNLIRNKPASLKVFLSKRFISNILLSDDSDLIAFAFKNCDDINAGVPISDSTEEKHYLSLLHYAVEQKKIDIVKMLIEHGADKNVKSEYKGNYRSVYDGFIKVTSGSGVFGEEQYNGCNAFAFAKDIEMIKILCENGLDANDKNKNGYTPLMFASMNGTAEMVNFLIEHNPPVNSISTDKFKMAPLLMAAFNEEDPEIINILLDHGAKIEQRANDNWTPLMLAVHAGNLRAAETLIGRGANVNATNDEGETALDIIYNYGRLEKNGLTLLALLKNSGAVNMKKTYR